MLGAAKEPGVECVDLSPAQGPEAGGLWLRSDWIYVGDFGGSRPCLGEGTLRRGQKVGGKACRLSASAAAAASLPLTWFSWAWAGSIRQYSGACLQPIPPPKAY